MERFIIQKKYLISCNFIEKHLSIISIAPEKSERDLIEKNVIENFNLIT